MNKLPRSHILNKKPEKYLKQGVGHCGAYSVKAVLSACGKDEKKDPEDYHTNIFSNFTGINLGRKYFSQILRKHGIEAETKTAKDLSDKKKLNLLKSLLAKDNPVMIRIGNGYRTSKYNPLLGLIIPHWITLWGYNDDEHIFYVYDSGLPKKYWDKKLAVGNTTRTYDEVLRDWSFGILQPWNWLQIGFVNYLYIKIHT